VGADWQHPQGPESDLNGLNDYPVVQVSSLDANAYCEWAERRLPTEAEWEKVAGGVLVLSPRRKEGSRKYPWGNNAPTGDLVNFCDKNCIFDHKDLSTNDGYQGTSPVGHYAAGASPYGALDMAGNVWEWVSDTYNANYYASSPRENPTGPSPSETKIIRGGSWFNTAPLIRVSDRDWGDTNYRVGGLGFRCAHAQN